jgi:hypothetical protein
MDQNENMFNDDEPSKMFTFEEGGNLNNQQILHSSNEERQSQRSAHQ